MQLLLFLAIILSPIARGETVSCEQALTTKQVGLFSFLGTIVKTRNIHKLVDQLEAEHGATSFRIPMGPLFGHRTIYVLQDRDVIKSVMRKESTLPFVNRNFDASHGHTHSINSVNTVDPLWVDLHNNLEEIFRTKSILPLMDKYQSMLTSHSTYNLNETLRDYYLQVWGEYCFGPLDDLEFAQIRDQLVEVLGKVFHENPVNRLPYLGALTSRIQKLRYRKELAEVDQRLTQILESAIRHKQGAFYELYERLKPKYPNAFQITRDNSFLAVLVYDFIHIVMLDTLANVAKHPELEREKIFIESRHKAFLYPFRFRIVEEDYDGFKKGDFAIVNLQKSRLYFSAGARLCPGARLFGELAQRTLKIFSDYHLRLTDPSQEIVRSPNLDLPFMLSQHEVVLERCPFTGKVANE